jgi:hypothetical protein
LPIAPCGAFTRSPARDQRDPAMVVDMIAMHKMQAAIMDEVDMRAVLHGHMLFARVAMRVSVCRHPGDQFLGLGIGGADIERMLIEMAVMREMEVAIVQIIDMARMGDGDMAAFGAVEVAFMSGMEHLMRHDRDSQQGDRQHGAQQGSVH